MLYSKLQDTTDKCKQKPARVGSAVYAPVIPHAGLRSLALLQDTANNAILGLQEPFSLEKMY